MVLQMEYATAWITSGDIRGQMVASLGGIR